MNQTSGNSQSDTTYRAWVKDGNLNLTHETGTAQEKVSVPITEAFTELQNLKEPISK